MPAEAPFADGCRCRHCRFDADYFTPPPLMHDFDVSHYMLMRLRHAVVYVTLRMIRRHWLPICCREPPMPR